MTDEIKTWLKRSGRDREWLGSQLGVTKRTVDNWLSAGQQIPESKLALIQRLMADDEAEEARRKQQLDPVAQVFSLEVDLPTFRAYNQAALQDHKTLEQWSIASLNRAAAAYFAANKQTQPTIHPLPAPQPQADDQSLDRVAEDPTPFTTAPKPNPITQLANKLDEAARYKQILKEGTKPDKKGTA